MTFKYPRTLCFFLVILGLSGCDWNPFAPEPPPPLSEEAIATRDAPPERVFQGTLAGEPTFLIVNDCEVFSVKRAEGEEVEWTSVLKLEPYPFFSVCERQSLSFDSDTGVLTAIAGRQAFGAGGCCIRGGTYQSRDGLKWKKV